MCIFGKIFNKMTTKQYLDAETIPYQVILREADGSYTDQFPQSFYVSREGNGFHANGGTGAHFLKRDFSAIDWGACLPVPDPIPTDTEGYMAYLSTYFTGQAIAPIPATPMQQYFFTNPITEDFSSDDIFIPISGGIQSTDIAFAVTSGFDGTIQSIHVLVTANTLDASTTFRLLQDGVSLASVDVGVAEAGEIAMTILIDAVVPNLPIHYAAISANTTGNIDFSIRLIANLNTVK